MSKKRTTVESRYLHRGQTGEIREKQEKYFKGKAVTFTVQRLTFFQYPVDLLTVFELYIKSSKYLKMGEFGFVGAICQSNLVHVNEMQLHPHLTAIIQSLAHFSNSL